MKVNQRILILCEGLTEYYYARALHSELPRAVQRSISVEVDYSQKNDPKHLANEAVRRAKKAKKERKAYDAIWLFFRSRRFYLLYLTYKGFGHVCKIGNFSNRKFACVK